MADITQGMILSAGFGVRLKPLTDKTPKPLIDVGGRASIEYSIELLLNGGIDEIVVNLHHLGGQVKDFLKDGSQYGAHIEYSDEKEILGTAGGIRKALGHFNGEPFIVTNCDVITDLDLTPVIEKHLGSENKITLVLRPLGEGENYTPISVENHAVSEFGRGEFMYTGIQVVSPELFTEIKVGEYANLVPDVYIPYAKSSGRIGAYIYDGFWMEIGTIENLATARKIFS